MKLIQHSFKFGELSPGLYARTDIKQFSEAAARMRNFFVDFKGGANRRAGTAYVGQCRSADEKVVLIPFAFSATDTYMLEFGHEHMRVIQNGGHVLEPPFINITGVDHGSPATFTIPGNTYSAGDWIYIDGLVGPTDLNNRVFVVASTSGDDVDFENLDGDNLNTTGYPAWTSGGQAARIYQIETPYAQEHLHELKYTQTNDVMTLTHPAYEPRHLSRTSATAWLLDVIDFGAALTTPVGVSVTPLHSPGDSTEFSYMITAVDSNGDESLPSAAVAASGSSFETEPEQSIHVSWTATADAISYNIYRARSIRTRSVSASAIHGFIGSATGPEFFDNNIAPDFSKAPPTESLPFVGAGNYPGVSEYFQQRHVFARTDNAPQTFWMTQPGKFRNLNESFPTRDDDALTGTLASRQVNEVKHLIGMTNGLIALTAGSAFQIHGGAEGGALTPASKRADPQVYSGASDVRPIIVGHDIYYIQSKGSTVRSLAYSFMANNYTGTDTTVLSGHLFQGKQIISWAYAEEPFKVIWPVRSDGILLSLTLLKEQEVAGWAWHDTSGEFKWSAAVTEGFEDVVYFTVRRRRGGKWYQLIERMASRLLPIGMEGGWFVDCGVSVDPEERDAYVQASAATGTGVTLESTTSIFTSGDIGRIVRGGRGKLQITAYNSGTQVTADVLVPIEAVMGDGIPAEWDPGAWSIGDSFSEVGGLWHLEGREVVALADGEAIGPYTVTNGRVEFLDAEDAPIEVSIARVGLGYRSQLGTLPLDMDGANVQGKFKHVGPLTIRFLETKGLYYGNSFNDLYPLKAEPWDGHSEDREAILPPQWDRYGQVCLEISEPYAATILGIMPDVWITSSEPSNERAG